VKGFNLIIDGGSYDSPISGHDASNDMATNKYAKQFCGWGGGSVMAWQHRYSRGELAD